MPHNSVLFSFLFAFLSLSVVANTVYPKNEFRAVWIATVANIDWPLSSKDPVSKQKADFLKILDTYKSLNFNAIFVQIRCAGDAFYPSDLAPWSRFLTGKEGKPPAYAFDPLRWMIIECHKRGFEFHAWLNPFRATYNYKTDNLSPKHDFKTHPEWMIRYAGKYYYNSGLKEVNNHLIAVVEEIVKHYDVDGIHFDDYFYPSRVGNELFDDSEAYKQNANGLSLEDWRRDNINNFLKNTHAAIKKIKPWVIFGVSPFGIWRNKTEDDRGSETEAKFTNYDDLFADPMAWMEGKYIDYIIPQLYWDTSHDKFPYKKILKWWSENMTDIAIYAGNASYKVGDKKEKNWLKTKELPNQIKISRSFDNVSGNAFYSAKSFMTKNNETLLALKSKYYKYPAIPNPIPSAINNIGSSPNILDLKKEKGIYSLLIKVPDSIKVRYIIVYSSDSSSQIKPNNPSQIMNKVFINPDANASNVLRIKFRQQTENSIYAISYVDYYRNESALTDVATQQTPL